MVLQVLQFICPYDVVRVKSDVNGRFKSMGVPVRVNIVLKQIALFLISMS